jgi:hypothetical protein
MAIQLVGIALMTALVALLFRHKLHKTFPLFLTYILFSILATLAHIIAASNYQIYFKVYWTTEALYAVLALLALYEAFHNVFILDYEAWPWFWMVFPGAVLILSAIFVGHALLYPPTGVPPLIALILSFETVVNCVKGGLLVMFLSLAWLLSGESWLTYAYGVVLGFAVSSAGSLLSYWLFSIFGTRLHWLGKYGPPVSYIVAVLIWIAGCFLPPEPKDRWKNFTDSGQALATVRQYMRALRWIAGKDR